MIVKSIELRKNQVNFNGIFFEKKIIFKKICIPLLAILMVIVASSFVSKLFVGNSFSSDMLVADFRTDVNKLWEASKIIESSRISNNNTALQEFGTSGVILTSNEINKNLKSALLNFADFNKDTILSEDEIKSLGIMNLNEEIYLNEIKALKFNRLSIDNNLKHYVIITKGNYAGTMLYNGSLKFIDSNDNHYFGVELF